MAKTRTSRKTTPKTSGNSATEHDTHDTTTNLPSQMWLAPFAKLHRKRMAIHSTMFSSSYLLLCKAKSLSQTNYGTDETSNSTSTSPRIQICLRLQCFWRLAYVALDIKDDSGFMLSCMHACVLLIQILPYFQGLRVGVNKCLKNTL
jgi:hypothetical protein